MTDFLPPQHIEAERSVLGSILIDSKEAMFKIKDRLHPRDFYRGIHGLIFAAMETIYEREGVVDIITLADQLVIDGNLKNVGGELFLSSLVNDVPSPFHVEHYADIVRQAAQLRRIMATCQEGLTYAMAGQSDPNDLIEATVRNLVEDQSVQTYQSLREVIVENVDEFGQHSSRGIPTGLKKLDNVLGGFGATDLIVVGARTSVGKTAFMLERALYAAKNGIPVGIFSLEMSEIQVMDRLLAHQSGIESRYYRDPNIKPSSMESVSNASGYLGDLPIFISTTRGARLNDILAEARSMFQREGIKMLVVDYVQKVRVPLMKGRSRQQEIGEVTRALKELAMTLNIPVVTASQLNLRDGKAPHLGNLRESGDIEQDADVVLLLHPVVENHGGEEKKLIECIVAKNRNGPAGEQIEMHLAAKYGRFVEWDRMVS